jgi:hypothetical protein
MQNRCERAAVKKWASWFCFAVKNGISGAQGMILVDFARVHVSAPVALYIGVREPAAGLKTGKIAVNL